MTQGGQGEEERCSEEGVKSGRKEEGGRSEGGRRKEQREAMTGEGDLRGIRFKERE